MDIKELKIKLAECDSLIIGAGTGLSTSAGYIYTGDRFHKYFQDFIDKYHFNDMYSGGFYVMNLPLEINWAYWSRYIYINRYINPPLAVYEDLYELVKDKDYFVLTTNVDHCFQKAGFDKKRLFYTQGDYGLFQCSTPCHKETYDNEETVRKMLEAQGFIIETDNSLIVSNDIKMEIPTELIPRCPKCNEVMSMNLRADNSFVEDEGWHKASERYTEFLRRHKETNTLFLELGVGNNTPSIIKYPFWQMTYSWPKATYACINYGEAVAPNEIKDKSILINGDIWEVIKEIKKI